MREVNIQGCKDDLGDRYIKVDSFFIRHTRYQIHQTLLKLGEYNLSVVPAFFNFDNARLLAVLTPTEVSLFSKYMVTTNTLFLDFTDPETLKDARFHVRVMLTAITPIPGKKNVCYMDVKFKAIPGTLEVILCDYLVELEQTKLTWEKLASQEIVIDTQSASLLGFKNAIDLSEGSRKWAVELKLLSTTHIKVETPELQKIKDEIKELPFSLRFTFASETFMVEGMFNAQNTDINLSFSYDLLLVIEDYLFRKNIKNKGSSG